MGSPPSITPWRILRRSSQRTWSVTLSLRISGGCAADVEVGTNLMFAAILNRLRG
jgi:hypothetical protein